jgi:hypothetical protein
MDEYAYVTADRIFLKTPDGSIIVIAGTGEIKFTELSEDDLNEIICLTLDPSNIIDAKMN